MGSEERFVIGNLVTHRHSSELGVGRVTWVNERTRIATVQFGDLSQLVGWDDLEHCVLQRGERVFSLSENMFGRVDHAVRRDDSYFYLVDFPFGRRGKPEADLEIKAARDPVERLADGIDLDHPLDFDLKTQATRLRLAYAYDDRVCLSNTRIELKYHHQIFVAHRVLQTYKPRFILADEVGLGKTIEAGLVLKELRARGLVTRALIVAPANLVGQWASEMRKKFNERFTIYDGPTVRFLEREHPGTNIWKLRENIMCSLQFARQPGRREEIAEAGWDFVIIDEAHHVRRHWERPGKPRSTQAYRLGQELEDSTEGMLLLTATPMQLHPFELFSLVELLDPTLFPTYADFEWHRKHEIVWINNLISHLRDYEKLLPGQRSQLLPGIQAVLERHGRADLLEGIGLEGFLGERSNRERLVEILGGFHKLSQVMIRNRKRVVGGFTEREARAVPVHLTEDEYRAYQRVTEWVRSEYSEAMLKDNNAVGFAMVVFQQLLTSSRYALMRSLSRRIDAIRARYIEMLEAEIAFAHAALEEGDVLEEEATEDRFAQVPVERSLLTAVVDESPKAIEAQLRAMQELYDELAEVEVDSKAAQLLGAVDEILSENRHEKILIFTRFLDTQEYLRQLLSKQYRVTIFNGGLNQEEKDKAIDEFRESAQIMISSEAGGEGRNLQFCHIMFNYDLPWNPMRIEQRIGRLDRIGQEKNVYIYNFSLMDTVEERILSALQNRIRLFEETVGGLDPILGTIERDLRRLIMEHVEDFDKEFEKFELSLEERIRAAREMEAKMSDFVMDTQSFHKETVLELLGRQPPVTWEDLQEFVRRFIGRYPHGIFLERAGNVVEIEVPRAFQRHYADLSNNYLGTFDPAMAIEQESLDFFAFGHPLIDAIIDFATSPQIGGYATVRGIRSEEEGGIEGLQLNYLVRFSGIRPLEKLYCLVFDAEGRFRPQLSQQVDSSWSESDDISDASAGTRELPLATCLEDSERILLNRLVEEQRELQQAAEELYQRELSKIDKVYELRIEKEKDKISADRELLQRLERSSDESERRIIPAIQGRIAAAERAIADLEEECKERREELERRKRVDFDFELLNAALLRTPASNTAR